MSEIALYSSYQPPAPPIRAPPTNEPIRCHQLRIPLPNIPDKSLPQVRISTDNVPDPTLAVGLPRRRRRRAPLRSASIPSAAHANPSAETPEAAASAATSSSAGGFCTCRATRTHNDGSASLAGRYLDTLRPETPVAREARLGVCDPDCRLDPVPTVSSATIVSTIRPTRCAVACCPKRERDGAAQAPGTPVGGLMLVWGVRVHRSASVTCAPSPVG